MTGSLIAFGLNKRIVYGYYLRRINMLEPEFEGKTKRLWARLGQLLTGQIPNNVTVCNIAKKSHQYYILESVLPVTYVSFEGGLAGDVSA
jgi:hypothetical protein